VNGLFVRLWDMTHQLGREVLEKAGLLPPANYTLRLKLTGERPGASSWMNWSICGARVEKFRAIRKEQQEGEDQGRASRRSSTRTSLPRRLLAFAGRPLSTVRPGS